ncbi:MAG: TIR domain-containing protein, partial [Gammaproteobacteria bacterium]
MTKVFISYSWDSPEHQDRIWELSNRLRGDGIDCDIDQYHPSPVEGWPNWMERQMRESDYVLVVCTENYLRRFEGREAPGKGQGVEWESLLTASHLYYADSRNRKFLPIVMHAADRGNIPQPLKSFTFYDLSAPEGYEVLYRHLTDQPKRPMPALGERKHYSPDRLPELPVKPRVWSRQPEAAANISGLYAQNGSIVIGKAENTEIHFHNTNQSPKSEVEAQAEEYETAYLQRMMSDCAGLEWLRLVRKQDEKTPAVGLDSVYTALMTESLADTEPNTKSKFGESPRRLSALEVLNGNQRLVLTGTPGSGKSAFVNYLALCLSGERLGDTRANLRTLTEPLPDNNGRPQTEDEEKREVRQPWDHVGLIPVRIILRDFAVSEYFPATDGKADAQRILNFLKADLENKACGGYFQRLEKRIRDGEAMLMFDGLDEVAKAGEKRKRLIACILGFVKSFGKARFLVTCRPFAYEQQDWQLEGFDDAVLAQFERGQMIRFIERWYSGSPDYDSGPAEVRSEKLKAALFQRPALYALAKQPLLLSLIAYLHANRHELPERRADLYERLLELLIDEWEKARFKSEDAEAALRREQHSLAEFLQLGQDTIRLVLERLAFQVHACEPRAQDSEPVHTADIAAKDLSHQLLCEAKKAGRERIDALEICEYLRDRVGILYQRGGASDLDAVYTFPHRSFQEYLAAAYLRREEKALFKDHRDCEDWQSLIAHLAGREPDRWREVVLLAGGIKSQKDPGPVWDLLEALYPVEVDEPDSETAWA